MVSTSAFLAETVFPIVRAWNVGFRHLRPKTGLSGHDNFSVVASLGLWRQKQMNFDAVFQHPGARKNA
jgi:hypothetical protein